MHYKSSQWHPTLLSRLCRSHPTTLDLSAQYKPTKPGGMGLVGVGLHCIRPCLKETPIDCFPAEEIQICHAEKFIALLSTHIRQMSSRPQHLSWGQEPLVDSGVATQLYGTSLHSITPLYLHDVMILSQQSLSKAIAPISMKSPKMSTNEHWKGCAFRVDSTCDSVVHTSVAAILPGSTSLVRWESNCASLQAKSQVEVHN